MNGYSHATAPRYWKAPVLLLFGLLLFYLCMFQRYRPYDIDNPWFLSFSYDTCVEHVDTDQFMDVRFPGGMDGTQLFGKIAAYTQCGVLNYTGWHQWPAAILSSLLVVFSLATWWFQFHRLGYSPSFILSFLLIVGISEPFLSMANKFRYESFSFALISLGLLLVSCCKPFWGMLVATLAIEIEPIALAGVIPIVVLACSVHKITRDLLIRLGSGIALAGVFYLALHPNILHVGSYLSRIQRGGKVDVGGFFSSYFFERGRHLPEVFFFVCAAIIYWRRRHAVNCHYLTISAFILTVFSIVIPHGNPSYMVFLYPFLIAMALIAFRAEYRPLTIIFAVMFYVFPQYAFLAYVNRGQGYRPQDIQQASNVIESAAQQLKISDKDLRIYGDYGLWFAHPHFYRAASLSTAGNIQDADIYLCYNSWNGIGMMKPVSMFYCPDLKKRLTLRLLSTTSIRDHILYLYAKQ